MRVRSAVIAAASIATSSAFLIVPEIENAVSEAKNSFEALVWGAPESLDVKCHECPYFAQEAQEGHVNAHERVYLKGVENTIHLEFSTQTGVLQINNATVFPLEMVNENFPVIKAYQTRVDNGEQSVEVSVDFALEAQVPVRRHEQQLRKHHHAKEEDHELFTIDFTVLGLGGVPIKAQTAHADLIQHDGVYTLARLRAASFEPTSVGQNDLDMCSDARNVQLCRVRLMATNRLREMMGAAHGRVQSAKEWMKTHGPGNKPRPCHGMRPGFHGMPGQGKSHQHAGHGAHGHRQHGHHHRHHRVLHYIFFFLKALVIPAVLGFAIGFTVSAVGVLVGRLIVFLWSRFYRGHRRGAAVGGEIAIEEGEKRGLMVDGEVPPAYEYTDEVPMYKRADDEHKTQE